MAKLITYVVLMIFILAACQNKKTITPLKKDNVVEKTAKRQVPEFTPTPEKPAPKLTMAQIKDNRKSFHYHIIAASYNYKNQAEGFKKKLYEKGYPSIVLEKNGKYRVVMQSFVKKEPAIKELIRLRKINKKSDLWLLRQ